MAIKAIIFDILKEIKYSKENQDKQYESSEIKNIFKDNVGNKKEKKASNFLDDIRKQIISIMNKKRILEREREIKDKMI